MTQKFFRQALHIALLAYFPLQSLSSIGGHDRGLHNHLEQKLSEGLMLKLLVDMPLFGVQDQDFLQIYDADRGQADRGRNI